MNLFQPTSLLGLVLIKRKQLAKNAGAVFYIDARKPQGKLVTKLDQRELPNGVKNSAYIQNVSDDLIINENTTIASIGTNTDTVRIGITAPTTRYQSFTSVWCDKLDTNSDVWADAGIIEGICGSPSSQTIYVRLNKSKLSTYDSAGVKSWLAKNNLVIRYQLQTPIDILNSGFKTNMSDLGYSNVLQIKPKNEFQYNPITWVEWGKTGATTDIMGAEITFNGANYVGMSRATTLKASTKYGLLLNIVSNNLVTGKLIAGDPTYVVPTTITIVDSGQVGNSKSTFTTPSTIVTNLFEMKRNVNTDVGLKIKIKDIRLFELPVGSQIESDFANLSADQLDAKYPPDNNAFMANFVGNESSGYVEEPVVTATGTQLDYTNTVINGDFSNGTTGWSGIDSIVTGVAEKTAASQYAGIIQNAMTLVQTGKRYYYTANVKADSSLVGFSLQSEFYNSQVFHSGSGNFQRLSAIVATTGSPTFINFRVRDERASGWTKFYVKECMLINLTDNPMVQTIEAALGRQLTAGECDRLFAFTASTSSVKYNIMPFLKFDGIDDYMAAFDKELDVLGTADFAICFSFMAPTIDTRYLFAKCLNSTATMQYGLYFIDGGGATVVINGAGYSIPLGTFFPNKYYNVAITRIAGRLKVIVNDIVCLDMAHGMSITSQPHFRIGTRSNDVNGTTATAMFNGWLGYFAIMTGEKCTEANVSKFTQSVRRGYV